MKFFECGHKQISKRNVSHISPTSCSDGRSSQWFSSLLPWATHYLVFNQFFLFCKFHNILLTFEINIKQCCEINSSWIFQDTDVKQFNFNSFLCNKFSSEAYQMLLPFTMYCKISGFVTLCNGCLNLALRHIRFKPRAH